MRPPIEEWKQIERYLGYDDCRFEKARIVRLCDYALALEKEKAELERKALTLIERAFREGRSYQATLERGTVLITSDQILKDIEQALKEEEP